MRLKTKKTKSFQSLWVTLAVAFSALSALVLLISSSLNMYLSFQTQQRLITNEQTFIARNAAHTVKSFVQKKLGVLKTTVHLGSLIDVDPEERDLALEKLLGIERAFRQLVLMNTRQQKLAQVSRLSNLVSGRLIERINGDLSSLADSTEVYISSVYIDEVTSEPLVIMAVPVPDIFGDFKGFLLAEVNLKFMWDLVGAIKVGRKGCAYVVDRQGKLIASGDINRVLKGENLVDLSEVNEFVKGDILIHKDSVDIEKGITGNYVVANHAHLGTPDWAVVVELPVLEAYKTVITTLITSGLIMVLSFAMAIIAGVYLSKRLTKPVISLRDAAIKIGRGELGTRIAVETNDEIGILAESFNRMAEDLGKTTTSVVNLHREISVRKEVEESLRLSEKRFEEVAENSGDWIWEVNTEGLYTYSSPVVEKLLGYKPTEIVGKKYFYDFFATDIKEELKQAAFSVFARQEKFHGLINPNIHRNGSTVILETYGTPVLDERGNLSGYRGADRDITERKRAEKSIENLNKDLESTVALLTQSNRQLREFVYLAAHDLKTPLRGIGTLAQWLVRDYKEKFDDAGRQQVDLLVTRVERMNELINAILQYSTITRDRQQERPVDLHRLVEAVLEGIKPPARIKVTIDKHLPTVTCRETYLRQVFRRLIANAVKFMDKPEGRVTIDYTDKGDLWEFSISDNGPGIASQHGEKIFQLFQRLDDNEQGKGGGTGLTFVRKIVELYGGQIWMVSEPGRGSTFFFSIPKVLDITQTTPDESCLVTRSSEGAEFQTQEKKGPEAY